MALEDKNSKFKHPEFCSASNIALKMGNMLQVLFCIQTIIKIPIEIVQYIFTINMMKV